MAVGIHNSHKKKPEILQLQHAQMDFKFSLTTNLRTSVHSPDYILIRVVVCV